MKQDGPYVYIEFSSKTKNDREGRVIIQYDKEAGEVKEWLEKQAV
ncbi:hypothetical protein RCO48_06125 [Peribacillus frigoritolerans]|nr:hypothetical protein [Peribacillus frigoritolerans]